MIHKMKISLFILMALAIFTACTDADKIEVPLAKVGGIDSSGGDAVGISYEVFQSEIHYISKFRIPLVFRRLQLYKKWNLQDIFHGRIMDLAELTSEDFLATIQYVTTEGACEGEGHSTDGSANIAKNEICISYTPFRKMLKNEGTRQQMIALLIHEISHLKGFGEQDAQGVQAMIAQETFAPFLSAQMDQTLKAMSVAASGLGHILSGVAYNHLEYSCLGLGEVQSARSEVYLLHPFLTNEVINLLRDIEFTVISSFSCENLNGLKFPSRKKLFEKLKIISQKFIEIQTDLVDFHGGQCDGFVFCDTDYEFPTGTLQYGLLSEKLALVEDPALLPPTKKSDVRCELRNFDTNEVLYSSPEVFDNSPVVVIESELNGSPIQAILYFGQKFGKDFFGPLWSSTAVSLEFSSPYEIAKYDGLSSSTAVTLILQKSKFENSSAEFDLFDSYGNDKKKIGRLHFSCGLKSR